MTEMIFRNFITLIIIGGLIGGSGVAIVADTYVQPQILLTEVTESNGTVTKTFKDNSLDESKLFSIWLGAAIGYGGLIVAFLYKAKKGNGEEA